MTEGDLHRNHVVQGLLQRLIKSQLTLDDTVQMTAHVKCEHDDDDVNDELIDVHALLADDVSRITAQPRVRIIFCLFRRTIEEDQPAVGRVSSCITHSHLFRIVQTTKLPNNNMSSDAPVVLITGITGFLAAHVLDAVLAAPQGFRVRGTLRSLTKADELLARFQPDDAKRIELIEVAKTESSDLSDAVRGVTYIAHTASPYQLQVDDVERDLLVPAIEGTLNLLRYAHKEPSIKKVAITSSFAAVTDFTKGGPNRPGFTYTKENWNPYGRKDAVGPVAYSVSKTLAERAAWDFVQNEKPGFRLSTFNPPMMSVSAPMHISDV